MSNSQTLSSRVNLAAIGIFGAVALALGVLVNAGASAQAQTRAQVVCTTHADMARQLEERHGERRTAVAVSESGSLIEVFSRPDGKTWSVIATMADGRTCLLLSGRDWYEAREVVQGPAV